MANRRSVGAEPRPIRCRSQVSRATGRSRRPSEADGLHGLGNGARANGIPRHRPAPLGRMNGRRNGLYDRCSDDPARPSRKSADPDFRVRPGTRVSNLHASRATAVEDDVYVGCRAGLRGTRLPRITPTAPSRATATAGSFVETSKGHYHLPPPLMLRCRQVRPISS